jgi:hypothetical protein
MSFPQEWTIQSQYQDWVHKAHTKHTHKDNATQKAKAMSNTDPTKTR